MRKEYKLTYSKEKPKINEEVILGLQKEGVKSDDLEGLREEIPFTLRDMQTMEEIAVRAIVSPNEEDLPDGDILWIQHERAFSPEEKPWRIKILERFDETFDDVQAGPKMHVSLAGRKGGMLRALLEKGKKGE